MTDLTELRRLAEAATPGPWDQAEGRRWRIYAGDVLVAAANAATHAGGEVNGDYIAAMHPQTTLALLDRLARAETLVAQCKATLMAMHPATGMPDDDVARLYNAMMEALGDER